MTLLGPQSPLGIPRYSARVAIKNWTEIQHYTTWKNLQGYRHGKLFNSRPRKKRDGDLTKLSRHQLRTAVAFLTCHAPVKKNLNITGLFYGDPNCRFYRMETETAHHIICCCEALARQRYTLGISLLNPKA
jgi:hypothetical protein